PIRKPRIAAIPVATVADAGPVGWAKATQSSQFWHTPWPPSPTPRAPPARDMQSGQPQGPSRRSSRGLDWFVFFVADVQTGFGPFVAVYLTAHKWTQIDIGLVLTVGGITALVGQIPGGAIVDAARSECLVAGISVAAIAISALAYALSPIFAVVLL